MLKVLHPGFFSTIQDQGRYNYRNKGVPVSGVMDKYSASIANALLENKETAAVMEITMTGPSLMFDEPTFIAISGAEMNAKLNDNPIAAYQVHAVEQGDTLSFGKLVNGFRSYLAIKNGFLTEEVLRSRSYYKPITTRDRVEKYMELSYEPIPEYQAKISNLKPESFHKEHILKVRHGPEYKLLNDNQLRLLFSRDFTIAKENNRMAYQLDETLEGHTTTMLTSATLPGTVQLTPAGKLIILMRDGQTTGGYPRILQLTAKAISILAQKKYGDKISFQL